MVSSSRAKGWQSVSATEDPYAELQLGARRGGNFHAHLIVGRSELHLQPVKQRRHRERDLHLCDAHTEAGVVTETERGEGAGLLVLVSWRREARDVELGRNRIELLEKVGHCDGNEERLVLFHQVTGELEVPDGVAHGRHRDRIHAQGLHDRAVEHRHVAPGARRASTSTIAEKPEEVKRAIDEFLAS